MGRVMTHTHTHTRNVCVLGLILHAAEVAELLLVNETLRLWKATV